MRKLPNRLSASKHKVGIPKRRAWNRVSFGVKGCKKGEDDLGFEPGYPLFVFEMTLNFFVARK